MARRPTIEQLARESGVSVATVDRVLNRRLPVRAETAALVHEAAVRIGFHGAGLIGRRLNEGGAEHRFGVLLLGTGSEFYRQFARELESAAQRFRCQCLIDHVSPQDAADTAAKLDAVANRTQAVAVVAPEHPSLSAAVERLKERGVPVFALLSDFAPAVRQGYVGVHNGKVGRTAAWMIAKCATRPGKVALFVGNHRFHGHELREMGFRAFFREAAPKFGVLDTVVNFEMRDVTHEALLELHNRHPDLAGVYVAGGGMEGALSAIKAMDPNRRPVAVCNEITPESRTALAENLLTMVIATPLRRLCRELLPLMSAAVKGEAGPSQIFLPFDIFLPESV